MTPRVQVKVLIVDDEPDVGFLFGKILRKRNLSTRFVQNLKEAQESIEAEKPAVIFLDNNLPDGQGIDIIPRLKADYPETRIIVVTANDTPGDEYKAIQKGADGFLGKPLTIDSINRSLGHIGE